MSRSQIKRYQDPAQRDAQSVAAKKQFASPEARALLSERGAKQFSDPAARAKMSLIKKRFFEDPAERDKRSAQTTKQYEDPAQRERLARAAREYWGDPEARRRQSKAKGGRPFFDEAGNMYVTHRDAADALGVSVSKVGLVLRGVRRHTKGYIFTYEDPTATRAPEAGSASVTPVPEPEGDPET